MSRKLPVRVTSIFRVRRSSAAELRSAWTGEAPVPTRARVKKEILNV